MNTFELCLEVVVLCALSFTYIKNALHMFQQNRYELYRYSRWLFDRKNHNFSVSLIFAGLLAGVCLRFSGFQAVCYVLFLDLIFALYLLYAESKKTYIKELVLTPRVKRQIVCFSILWLIFVLCSMTFIDIWFISIMMMIMPYFFIFLVGALTYPMEERIKKGYENEARDILDTNSNLIKIGITGSYGKTSTKNIITDILSDHYLTLMTPASYNTPMGITRTVREMMKPIHEVFVCEMGADKVDDISYLMDFVKPKYGIVTSIGPQHLNTFRSMDNIIKEKMNEIEMLPADGVGFINLDNEYIRDYEIKNTCRIISVSIDNEDADYRATKIVYSRSGTSFSLKIGKRYYKFQTALLGKHNVTNTLIGIALGIELGMSVKEIQKAVANIRQVEHRLEIKKINGYTFIDDAFNANPLGSKMSLDVLSMMPERRVIVTPGMIDLGEKEDEINYEFGTYMKDRADFVILVGEKQTECILKGLIDSGFKENGYLVTNNVREAFDYVYTHFSVNDTILLENDLPDAFNK
ncbi:MAG: UDP-N-acetylmuramoyl-tripeptide--D-alanyl-D-alanine ligase [Erysipelotrichaceae bacterium]|nr:UDP-N-acetylmuramoyl-tripeptide--D-alanyl-D-alanine ligase [Erysipelotrichaceae bacterium]